MNKKLTCHREIIDFRLSSSGVKANKIDSDHSMKMMGMFQKLKVSSKSQVYKKFSIHYSNSVYDHFSYQNLY